MRVHGGPVPFLVCLTALLVMVTTSARGWEIESGRLAAAPIAAMADLEGQLGEGWLLARSSDLAVLLLSPAAGAVPGTIPLETVDPEAAYYLYLCRDATRAEFNAPARVLFSTGRTALVATTGATPTLTEASAPNQTGLKQPILISLTPKPWPKFLPEAPAAPLTEFDPAITSLVSLITQSQYTATWQILDDFETRYTYTTQNDNSAVWMRNVLASYGLDATYFLHQQSGLRKNVVATLLGETDPENVVYLVGHFDSITSSPESSAPGADDNGSGTAAFLEVARILSQCTFDYTIKFVGFNGEEQGLVGSYAYVNSIYDAGETVAGCYNLDMIAYRGEDLGAADFMIYTDTPSAPLARILADACLTFFPTQLEPRIMYETMSGSDHASFWAYGYKAVCGIEAEPWGDDFCPWYHTTNDRIERYPKDYPTWCTASALAAVAHTAGVLTTPTGVDSPMSDTRPRLVLGPNPFLGTTQLRYDLAQGGDVRLEVFDVLGRRIRTLQDGPLAAGSYETAWDGRLDSGTPSGAGVYWVRLTTGGTAASVRAVLAD